MNIPHLATTWRPSRFPHLDAYRIIKPSEALFSGMAGASDAYLIADLFASLEAPILVIVDSSRRAEILADECRSFVAADLVAVIPSRDAIPYSMKSVFGPITEARFAVFSSLLNNEKKIYIAPVASLVQKLVPSKDLFNRIVRLTVGDDVSQSTLAAWLTEIGFRKESAVSDVGTFAIRGGIFDIYPLLSEGPLRIEFFGNTIESMREFDVFTQKSRSACTTFEVFPMHEFCFDDDAHDRALAAMVAANLGETEGYMRLLHQWKTVGDLDGAEWFLHWFAVPYATLFEYLPSTTTIVWDDVIPLGTRVGETKENYIRHCERVPPLFLPLVSPPQSLMVTANRIVDEMALFPCVYIDTALEVQPPHVFKCGFLPQPATPHNLELFVEELKKRHQEATAITIVAQNLGNAERLYEMISEECPFVSLALGYIHQGYVDTVNKQVVYTEGQIFERPHRAVRQKKRVSGGVPLAAFDAVSPGDFVVHVDHGIARFVGIETVCANDIAKDCMVLFFADSAKLFVPVDDFHKVQKYIGKEGTPPTLSKLGSGAWEKLKARTKESLHEMAQELIDLYAKRQHEKGIAFSIDTFWQKEFEDSFIYDETVDQLSAIKDVKKDMESLRPMDRLVCGDVGFGKTEVAMRAAFKAVMDGYQVAVLAPTTILANQHFETFKARMGNFPVRMGVLSRFQSSREVKQALAALAEGTLNILIGTHRILSADVAFKNIGLLVIDEEQKFGVAHKEKLKHFRSKIDVLSMTATPIPRTLNMSLMGVRDLSMITTPPRNRLPVETVVAEYSDEIIRNAIDHELSRGGQVFVVHNRIKNLELLRDRIEQLCPRARVFSAHGQMHEHELESVMSQFIAGNFDVLVSTVIIENGLDISNVNTIIVNRADALGLSQLYQLRGRVGRSSEQAQAYFLTTEFNRIDEKSLRRLRALEQFTELGSGFQIAMRDLEIRGAGNLLGIHQSGFVAAVGFDLYCKLLAEAVKEISGEKVAEPPQEVKVELPLQAILPPDYIADGAVRVGVYQDLSTAASLQDLVDIERSLIDRFGPLPHAVVSLLLHCRIKVLAAVTGFCTVSLSVMGECTLCSALEGDRVQALITSLLGLIDRPFSMINEIPLGIRFTCAEKEHFNRTIEVAQILAELHAKNPVT